MTQERNCWTCANRHFGWNDDYIDGDYHVWVCDRNGCEGYLLDSNDYTKKKAETLLKAMEKDCKNWMGDKP